MPIDANEAIDRAKGGLDVLNEYREPDAVSVATTAPSKPKTSSSFFIYSIPIVFFIIVLIIALYIRYKKTQ